jgi:hypothetical protein
MITSGRSLPHCDYEEQQQIRANSRQLSWLVEEAQNNTKSRSILPVAA